MISFDLTLFDDAENRRKGLLLNRLELMFDDSRNFLPLEYFKLAEALPFGSKVRVTFDVLHHGTD